MTPKYLFWTSGWDSTYRLLEIILLKKEFVQLIYIIDSERKSLNHELKAIEIILKEISIQFPESLHYILPLKYYKRNEITIPTQIHKSFQIITNNIRTGSQYEWLAALCEQENLTDVEIGIFENERSSLLFGNNKSENNKIKIDIETKKAIDQVFGKFSFPIINTNKKKMYHSAKEFGWLKIMNLTWFCHKPKNNKPCGKCKPCTITISEGLGFRIPMHNRIKGYVKILLKKYGN